MMQYFIVFIRLFPVWGGTGLEVQGRPLSLATLKDFQQRDTLNVAVAFVGRTLLVSAHVDFNLQGCSAYLVLEGIYSQFG